MTYDLRKLHRVKHLRNLCVVLAGALAGFQVNAQYQIFTPEAQVYPDRVTTAFDRMLNRYVGEGIAQVALGGTGTELASPSAATLATNGGPKIDVTRTGGLTNPSGNPYTVSAKSSIPVSKFVPVLKKALALAPVLGTGIELYNMIHELGYEPKSQTPGYDRGFQKTIPSPCTAGTPCYYWRGANNQGFPSASAAAQSQKQALIASTGQACNYTLVQVNSYTVASPLGQNWAYMQYWNDSVVPAHMDSCFGGSSGMYVYQNVLTVTPDIVEIKTLDDLANDIASKSGWPSNSKISKAVADALNANPEPIPQTDPLTVTGPATSTGRTKTTTGTDGSSSTQTTTHNHTYQGNNISTTTVTVNNNYNPTTNTTNSTTTTETPEAPTDATDPQKTDCDKYPNSNGCRTDEFDTPSGEIPKTSKTITYEEKNLGFGGGSCPADAYSSIHGQSVKVWDWSATCGYVTSYVKPLLISIASLSALLIVFVGGKPE